ncbi:hypothetical protein ET495_17110 [Xylanimonas allomyrinae]|uniref:Uncharacterized protein n=1 Tax=Xylanimonas allomyrinae TaxID=2509459 RepID=A0A4P6EPD8_9MICO|nr:hypothetical protein [Xylanimonas allomyrinae]QAY64634.1 hypothetical protein ET495_17110 [Xylanimonas allomyrinae]
MRFTVRVTSVGDGWRADVEGLDDASVQVPEWAQLDAAVRALVGTSRGRGSRTSSSTGPTADARTSRAAAPMGKDVAVDPREARAGRRTVVPTAAMALAVALVAGLAACSPEPVAVPPAAHTVEVRDLHEHTPLLTSPDPAALAVAASKLVFETSPVVVVAGLGDDDAAAALSAVTTALRAPALLADGSDDRGLRSEAARLGARAAVIVEEDPAEVAAETGAAVEPSATEAAVRAAGLRVVRLDPDAVVPGGAADGAGAAPGTEGPALDRRRLEDLRADLGSTLADAEPALLTEVLALVDPAPGQEAALATLRAAGAVTRDVPGGDPGASGETVRLLSDAQALTVVGVGPGFADPATFAWQVAAAEGGQLLPNGSQRVLPARFDAVSARVTDPPERALVSTDDASPDDASTGTASTGTASTGTASTADPDAPRVPALVLRSATRLWDAGPDRTYLRSETVESLTPMVDAARRAGRYVVLNLEGGSIALLDQVRVLEPLIAEGGVGVFVHPEQRRSGAGIVRGGSVDVAELQAVVDYLAAVVTQHGLPQVLLAVGSLDSAVHGSASLVARPQVAVVDGRVLGVAR